MATYRNLETRFWMKGWVEEATSDMKLLFLYFLTCPYRNEAALFELTMSRVSHDTSIPPARVKDAMTKLIALGRIEYDNATNEIWICNAYKRQVAKNPNCVKSAKLNIKNCNSAELRERILKKYPQLSEEAPNAITVETKKRNSAIPIQHR